jgi:hypothetical protein
MLHLHRNLRDAEFDFHIKVHPLQLYFNVNASNEGYVVILAGYTC